jgi:hypothetical protein
MSLVFRYRKLIVRRNTVLRRHKQVEKRGKRKEEKREIGRSKIEKKVINS